MYIYRQSRRKRGTNRSIQRERPALVVGCGGLGSAVAPRFKQDLTPTEGCAFISFDPGREKEASEGHAGQLGAWMFLNRSEIVNARHLENQAHISLFCNGVAIILDRYHLVEKEVLATKVAGWILQNWLEYYTSTSADAASLFSKQNSEPWRFNAAVPWN